jgi:uncharacterized membrane protein YdjX (TVP38/TMEM64 family)
MKKAALLTFTVVLLYAAWRALPLALWMNDFVAFIRHQGAYGFLIFFAIYVVASLLLLPGPLFTFLAGMLYGFWGLPLVLAAAATAASIAFEATRLCAREQISNLMAQRKSTRGLQEAISRDGWKFMILLRISPLVPFNLNNYFLGAMPVKFSTYFGATVLGALPGTLVYIYLGALGRNISEQGLAQWILVIVGIIASSFLGILALKKTKAAMKRPC